MSNDRHQTTIEFACPKCQQKVKRYWTLIGQKTECPSCNETISVPDPKEPTPNLPTIPEPIKAKAEVVPPPLEGWVVGADNLMHFSCQHCEKEVAVPLTFCGRVAHCPWCGGQVLVPVPILKAIPPKPPPPKTWVDVVAQVLFSILGLAFLAGILLAIYCLLFGPLFYPPPVDSALPFRI